ncbi:Predicted Zn-dependent peptidase [Salegentibacter echinorum]|uniref:Predicted Zn-dependent peptidase n=1 Tax=Salegentibacter echinorum TaxID=1073325 RepID=A0A1M5MA88_SALEC|nr:insulinase family protein [Salegentibacter echinorum]SHG74155.1 Predicted Zn-dependent peptidase [Salegentibacter echinorum]
MRKQILLLIIAFLSLYDAGAQPMEGSGEDIASLDPSIRYGRLANGFTYYIKAIPKSNSNLTLNLYVLAGNLQEDQHQLNIAHAVEHMAFKSSKNFPHGITNSKLQEKNMGRYDITGNTGTRMVQYAFNVPKDNPEILGKGLVWFKDIANGLLLKEDDINQVRGELREEFILMNGTASDDLFAEAKLRAALFPGVKPLDDFFIHNQKFKPESLRKFYKDWYRPEFMAISIVGNINNPDHLEKLIKRHFSSISTHKKSRELEDYDALYYDRPKQFKIVERGTDTVNQRFNESVAFQMVFRDSTILSQLRTLDGVKQLMKLRLLKDAVGLRIKEATNEYNASSASVINFFDQFDLPPAMAVTITTTNEIKLELQKIIEVLHQMQHYGLEKTEWEYLKKEQLLYLDKKNKEDKRYWIEGIARHYKYGEAFPSNKFEHLEKWLSGLSLDQFNKYIFEFLSKTPEDIGIIAPTGDKVLSHTESEIRSWIKEAYQKMPKIYKVPVIPERFMSPDETAKLRKKNYLVRDTKVPGAREVILNNGVRVVMKSYTPTPGSYADKIMIQGFNTYGASCFIEKDHYSTLLAPQIVKNSGVGTMDKFSLQRMLENTSLQVSPYIGYDETGISGRTSIGDLEKTLQLIYLYFTSPRMDTIAFEDWKRMERTNYHNPNSSSIISTDFYSAIRKATGDHVIKRGPLGSATRVLEGTKRFEGVEKTNLKVAYENYKKLFSRAADFTFLISGKFEVDSILPIVQKYLGNLPNNDNRDSCSSLRKVTDISTQGPFFEKILTPDYYSIKNHKYSLRFIQDINAENWREQIRIQALGGVLREKAWALRYEKGYGLYHIGAFGIFNKDMNRYEIGFNFNCTQDDLPLIQKEARQIIAEVKSGSITDKRFKNGLKRMHSIYKEEKAYKSRKMQERLYEHYRYSSPWQDPIEVEKYVQSLTIEDIVEVANKYCKQENLFEFVMINDD